MTRLKFHLSAVFAVILSVSCTSAPAPEASDTQAGSRGYHDEISEVFDPENVSEELYLSTKMEVQDFIKRLNQLIVDRDFEAWRAALSPELLEEFSSEEYLKHRSEQLARINRRIVLRSVEDYFNHVVVPARVNVGERVENVDIKFITMNRVQAFTLTTNRAGEEHQVRLFDLEKIEDLWTIIN